MGANSPTPTSPADLELIKQIVTWVIGILTPVITGMSIAIYKLWDKVNRLQEAHAEELKGMWKDMRDAFVEQGKVIERLGSRIRGGKEWKDKIDMDEEERT